MPSDLTNGHPRASWLRQLSDPATLAAVLLFLGLLGFVLLLMTG